MRGWIAVAALAGTLGILGYVFRQELYDSARDTVGNLWKGGDEAILEKDVTVVMHRDTYYLFVLNERTDDDRRILEEYCHAWQRKNRFVKLDRRTDFIPRKKEGNKPALLWARILEYD